MIVMWHRFRFSIGDKKVELESKLIAFGDDPVHTAMSKTVGLPIAIAAKHILQGKWNLSGVHLPTIPAIYEPVLEELESMGISFIESKREI
jgi:saccharopine dehydrogenase (NADP+, L-glutamate forming)